MHIFGGKIDSMILHFVHHLQVLKSVFFFTLSGPGDLDLGGMDFSVMTTSVYPSSY